MANGRPDPIFVNTLSVNGFVNGVLNLAFTTAHWYSVWDENARKHVVEFDEPVTVDLRMDLACAQALRDALDRIIEANTKPSGELN